MPQMFDDVGEIVEEALRRVGKRVVMALPLGIGKPNLIANEFFRRARADPGPRPHHLHRAVAAQAHGRERPGEALRRSAGGAHFRQLPRARLPRSRAPGRHAAERARHRVLLRARLAAQQSAHAQSHYLSANYTHVARELLASRRQRDRARGGAPHRGRRQRDQPRQQSGCHGGPAARHREIARGRTRRWCCWARCIARCPSCWARPMFARHLRPAARSLALRLRPVRAAEPGVGDRGPCHRAARQRAGARRRHPADRHRGTGRLHRLFVAAAPPAERGLAARPHGRRHRAQRHAASTPSAAARPSPPACSAPPRCSSTRCSTCTGPASCAAGSTTIYRCSARWRRTAPARASTSALLEGLLAAGAGPRARRRGRRRAQGRRRAAQRMPLRERHPRLSRRAHASSRTSAIRARARRWRANAWRWSCKGGTVMHAGFLLGPRAFYSALSALPESERRLFDMRGVGYINQLYGADQPAESSAAQPRALREHRR